MAALLAQQADKLLTVGKRTAFAGDVTENVHEILFGAVEIFQSRQIRNPL
jgi:hypothetical protein